MLSSPFWTGKDPCPSFLRSHKAIINEKELGEESIAVNATITIKWYVR
jgi:hypothetical protein